MNPLKYDPTRTKMIRMGFESSMRVKFNAFRKSIENHDPEEVDEWVEREVESYIHKKDVGGDSWTDYWIRRSYGHGAGKAYSEVYGEFAVDNPLIFFGGKKQFLHDLMGAEPISALVVHAAPKLRALFKRVFGELKGVTDAMAQKMARAVADGMTRGESEKKLRERLKKEVDGILVTRALRLARTEVIRANAEGKLDAYERFGIREVAVEAEWVTAGDSLVCPLCKANEGKIFTLEEIRGLIPLHPECRCEPRIVRRRLGRV